MAFRAALRPAARVSRVLATPVSLPRTPSRGMAGEKKKEYLLQYTKIRDSYFMRSALPDDFVNRKVVVAGAAGGIGQPLSLLLKINSQVTDLALYDLAPVTPGVAADLSHCNVGGNVKGYTGEKELEAALAGADVVVIPAGVPRKPGMTRDDLFNTNASIVANLAKYSAKVCPNATFLIISNPVNSTVPIFAEIMRRAGVYNPKKVFGVTLLDVVRANTFVSEHQGLNVVNTSVPVIGGHAGATILPLLSQVPDTSFSQTDKEALTKRIQFGGDEVVAAKAGAGSATLSMAYAGAAMTDLVLRAMNGENNLVACAFVESDVAADKGLKYFASPIELGREGVARARPYGALDAYETQLLEAAVPELKSSIEKGIAFAKKYAL